VFHALKIFHETVLKTC